MADENGRIKLTWAQITYCLTVLVVLISGWFNTQFNMKELRSNQDEMLIKLKDIEAIVKADYYTRDQVDQVHNRLQEQINSLTKGKR